MLPSSGPTHIVQHPTRIHADSTVRYRGGPRISPSWTYPRSLDLTCSLTQRSFILLFYRPRFVSNRLLSLTDSRIYIEQHRLLPSQGFQDASLRSHSPYLQYHLIDRAVMFCSVPGRMCFYCRHLLVLDSIPQTHQPAGVLRLAGKYLHQCGNLDY